VEYSLTKKGRALAGPVDAIAEWAHHWIPVEVPEPQRGEQKQRPSPTRIARRRAGRARQAPIVPGRGDSAVRRG
jgi:hypothetical protein